MSGDHWLLKIKRLIDWSAFELPLGSLYSHTGRPLHPPLVMFKMLLLEQWCYLWDAEVEAQTRVIEAIIRTRKGRNRFMAT
ncbi:hypothetical protein [Sulfuricystis thermophila]|uniref:hypothetical protein n=1 Tax=Sulfuricystis thermophila TaxID=2496847 RepID=UPI001035CE69|nr:hypothetical protein [Sulfuricystis thermophila]